MHECFGICAGKQDRNTEDEHHFAVWHIQTNQSGQLCEFLTRISCNVDFMPGRQKENETKLF